MIAKIALCVLLIGILCAPAAAQGCGYGVIWGVSGYAAGLYDPPPTSATAFQPELGNAEATYGPANCTFTLTPYDWYGYCSISGYFSGCVPAPPPEAPQETAPGPQSCPTCVGGKPINFTNGNVYIEQTDVKLPGLGPSLTLERTWNSMWPQSQSGINVGLFGPSWRSTYEERILVSFSPGPISVAYYKYARAQGNFWTFVNYGRGSTDSNHPIAPSNEQATLGSYPQWTLTFGNGEKRLFDITSGNLTDIIDRNGNDTHLTYDSAGRLVTVTDPASRHLYFGYGSNTSRLVTSVTSDVGLTLSYAYDAQGRLTQVTNPDLTTLTYTYDANSMITSVTDSNGKVLESHTYGANGLGLTSTRALGADAITVSYPSQ
jgi:YD repeat-containing protein